MKKLKVLLSVLLVVCMVVGFAPLHATASAAKEDWEWYWSEEYRNRGHWNGWSYHDGWYELSDKWYQVDFSPVKIPVQLSTPGTTSNGAATAAGSTVQMVDTSFTYFYNEWAGTLIIRGTGEMPSFSKEYPAPWANLKDKAARVIIERNITKISSNAFVDFSRLRSVVLPATLKAIDPDAFVWSEETRALKTFRPLERLEFSGDLDTLDKILKAANIRDLLDARIVKVTEKAIQDEIWQLTWYRIRKPIRVKYDRAGRPILIERIDENGKYFKTAITWDDTLADGNVRSPSQPLSIDTEDSGKAFSREVIEKRETYSVNPNGVENLYEFEKNDLGQTTYFASFHLDNGAITSGYQSIADEKGLVKTGILKSITSSSEETRREWENTLADGVTLEKMTEILDKFGRVKSIETSKGDSVKNTYVDGRLSKREVTEAGKKTTYDYTYKGSSLDYVTADDGSGDKNIIQYSYYDNGAMATKVQTQGSTKVTSYYGLYNRVGREVFTNTSDGKVQYVYSYEYDNNGVVSKRIVTDAAGKVIRTDSFNSAGVLIKKVSTTVTVASVGEEIAEEEFVSAASLMTTMVTEYDPETGNTISETVETTDGITSSKTSYTFNNLGMLTNVSSSFTDEEGKTSDFSLNSSYDVEGNIVQQTEETSDFDNNSKVSKYIFGKLSKPLSLDVTESTDGTPTARSFSTFLYHSDGSFAETVTELNNDGSIGNSYIINHDAPVEEEANVVEEDAEETEEDADVTDEDADVTDEDADVTDEDADVTGEGELDKEPVEDGDAAQKAEIVVETDDEKVEASKDDKSAAPVEGEDEGKPAEKKADIIVEDQQGEPASKDDADTTDEEGDAEVTSDEDDADEERRRLVGFRVGHVFDVSQTDGEPLPTLVDEVAGGVESYAAVMEAVLVVTPVSAIWNRPFGFAAPSPLRKASSSAFAMALPNCSMM